jgi:hypothetical protein
LCRLRRLRKLARLRSDLGCEDGARWSWRGKFNGEDRTMNRLLGAAACALMIAALSGCSGSPTIYGGIQRLDPNARTVTLYNGSTYTFDAATDLSKFKVADEVRIAYRPDPATRRNVGTSISLYR